MYKQLTMNECLFVVDDFHLETFKQLAESIAIQEVEHFGPLTFNSWAMAFNIWCLLNEDESSLVMDYEKMLTYSSNFHYFDLIRGNKKLKEFRDLYNQHEDFAFVTAYFLACESILLIRAQADAFIEQNHISILNEEWNYFTLEAPNEYDEDVKRQFYKAQKLIISILSQSTTFNDSFEKHIEKAIKATRKYYSNK